jgi:hypothetical protein
VKGDLAVTTVETPSNEDSKSGASRESTASALRRRREESVTDLGAAEVRRETQELARTLGAASISLVELQRETSALAERTESARVETLERMNGLVESARRSFGSMERQIESNGLAIQQQLGEVRAAAAKRAAQEKWQLRAFIVAVLTVFLLSGWGGWSLKAWRAETAAAEERAALRKSELFGMYLLEIHPKEADKYWRAFQSWTEKNGINK